MPAKLDGKHVLVVDDDPDVLASVKLAFESSGAKVTTGRDGNQAIDLTKKLNPDLVILDMMMPKRSGFLVMESIKPNHDVENPPFVIMITANEGKRHELYARHLGVSDYLTKPFSIERLLERACQLLGGQYLDAEGL
jgi:DNA-binding response OmpR family regulator